jgi:formylglycine-generating enzyme required for sulfatase activity
MASPSAKAGSAPRAPGERIDRYELVAPVRGGRGALWVARARGGAPSGAGAGPATERLVTLRLVPSELRDPVLHEARLAMGVAHANAARVLDCGTTDGVAWVASEWVDGESLADLRAALDAKKARFPASILLRIVADACAGLHAAHLLRDREGKLLNVVHGDVSLRTLVIAASGATRVVDLGFAKGRARAAGRANRSWAAVPGALAPPPAQRVDRHADVWAIGAILELLLGYVTEGAPGEGEAEPELAPNAEPTLASLVHELIHRATAVDPVERFATAAEMQGAVEAAMVTLGIPATRANVASFVAEHLAASATARAREIDDALAALGPASVRATPEPPAATIDSLPAIARSVGPGTGLATPSAFPRALPPPLPASLATELAAIARAEEAPRAADAADDDEGMEPTRVRPRSISQAFFDAPAAAPAAVESFPPPPLVPAPPKRRFARALAFGSVVGLVTAAMIPLAALGFLGLRERVHEEKKLQVAATPAPPPKLSCPDGTALVPGGRFYMGSDEEADIERPAHRVQLSPYCIDRFEVTTEQYKACSDAGECKRGGTENKWDGPSKDAAAAYDPLCNLRDPVARAKHPVNCVDWDMARAYCEARGGRLPTEAEWELAARGPDGRTYPWGDDEPGPKDLNACGKECASWAKDRVGHLDAMHDLDDGWAATAPVGSFPAGRSRYGAEDMVGNVAEWVADWFAPYSVDVVRDPHGPAGGDERVIRGGAWNDAQPSRVRPTFRDHGDPGMRSHAVGFRCVRAPDAAR